MQSLPWALITGASGDIGQAISAALAKRGIPLYLHYHQNGQKLEPILHYCQQHHVPAYPVQADLRDPAQIGQMFQALPVKPLLLVNNASIDHVGLISDVSPAVFDELVSVNIRSTFFVTQNAIPAMVRERFGRIVNISSIWGMTGSSCEALYSLTKGAVLSFTKACAKELAPSGITVNAVAPGAIAGGMMQRFTPADIYEIEQEIPLGRLGTADEVASLVAYLLSAESGYITGQVISPNGGWYT